jgi:CRP-like cAMP-binding protein
MSPVADISARLAAGGFDWLGPDGLDTIARASRIARMPQGAVLFRQGDASDGCYLILSGAVKVLLSEPEGQQSLLAILGQGDIVGEMALIDRLPRSATVMALKGCELCHLNAAAFDRLVSTDIAVYRQLLCVLSARLRAGNERHATQRMALSGRLARAFLRLAATCGEQLPDRRVLIRQRVSQAELGHLIGAARENVNRQLAEWRRHRLLSRISGYYCLEDPAALEPLARGEARADRSSRLRKPPPRPAAARGLLRGALPARASCSRNGDRAQTQKV